MTGAELLALFIAFLAVVVASVALFYASVRDRRVRLYASNARKSALSAELAHQAANDAAARARRYAR